MSLKKVEYQWLGRSLENYKIQQRKVAESKNVLEQFLAAKTLTKARQIVYGIKKGSKGR